MADILPSGSVSITELLARLKTVKHNPSTIQRVVLEYLDEVTDGAVNIVDPTNPFVFLLESSAVNTALAVNENIVNLRKQYASLAQTEDEIYNHMSDKDYINRFSTPATAEFIFTIQVNDLLSKMVYDAAEDCHKAIIPRDTEITVDGYVFTLQYPIVMRKYSNGMVIINYDASILSPLSTLSGNIIDYTVRKDGDQVDWASFKINVSQFEIQTTHFPLQKSVLFSESIVIKDKFYYVRAFYRNDSTLSEWKEMKTTHSEQVYDPFKPTVLVKVTDGTVNLSIPPIYMTNGSVSGEVRFDVYTTKGKVSVNLSNYKLPGFITKLRAIDELRDLNAYTNVMSSLSYYAYSAANVVGGTDGLTFEKLRERVIFNTTGDQQLPITNVEIHADVNDLGFDLVKNIDVLTNRVFLATQKLPAPQNVKLTTAANIGISAYTCHLDQLKLHPRVANNNSRLTVMSKNLFLHNNGIVTLLTPTEIEDIRLMGRNEMVSHLNNTQYVFNPYHYVLDSSQNEFEVRAYSLDYPAATELSFLSQNYTLQLPVNTGTFVIEKKDFGYRFAIVTKSGNFYKEMEDAYVGVQLAYYPKGETILAYIQGTLVGHSLDNERMYQFDIHTNHDIDSNGLICITNSKMFANEVLKTWIDLSTQFHIVHHTSSLTNNFVSEVTDSFLGKFLLRGANAAIAHETINLELGIALKNLWTRSRSLPTGLTYRLHTVDTPLLYDKDVYDKDPITGSIFTIDAGGNLVYNVMHPSGSPVLNNLGEPVYRYRKGDVVMDANGDPTIDSELTVNKEIDILFVDGKQYFVNDLAFLKYNDELINVIKTWITKDISSIQQRVLEQTKVFFFPKTTLGKVKVYTEDGGEDYLSSEQSLVVDLYVKPNIYSDRVIQQQLIDITVKILDSHITELTVNITEIVKSLIKAYGDSVPSLTVAGLGGSKDYKVVQLAEEEHRLCLKKVLKEQQDGTLIIVEDVIVNFRQIK